MGAEYNPTDAAGFIRLFGLQMKAAGALKKHKKRNGK
jgi:hypothetical protein